MKKYILGALFLNVAISFSVQATLQESIKAMEAAHTALSAKLTLLPNQTVSHITYGNDDIAKKRKRDEMLFESRD